MDQSFIDRAVYNVTSAYNAGAIPGMRGYEVGNNEQVIAHLKAKEQQSVDAWIAKILAS